MFKKIQESKIMPFVIFRGDHLRSILGIICGSGSFAVQFRDHFRSGDHLRSGIICGAVQALAQLQEKIATKPTPTIAAADRFHPFH